MTVYSRVEHQTVFNDSFNGSDLFRILYNRLKEKLTVTSCLLLVYAHAASQGTKANSLSDQWRNMCDRLFFAQ